MSTHAEVFFERDDGTVTGTYVHYDGYPRVCGAAMAAHSYDDIKRAITNAQARGGLRCLYPDKIEGFSDKRSCVIGNLKDARERYVYIKNRDGSVDMVSDGVRARLHPPVSGQSVTEQQLINFLDENLGSRCLDDEDDRRAVAAALLQKFNMAQR